MATYYVDPVNGDDGNSGLTLEDAFATKTKAASVLVAGDVVYCVATGNDTEAVKVTITVSSTWIGVNSSGVEDGTKYFVTGPASDYIFEATGGACTLRNFEFDETRTFNHLHCNPSTIHLVNVKAHAAVAHVLYRNDAINAVIVGCDFANVTNAVSNNGVNRGSPSFYGCRINNVAELTTKGHTVVIANCLLINSKVGGGHYGGVHIIGSVFYNTPVTVGDRAGSYQPLYAIDSVFMNSPGYSLNWYDGGYGSVEYCLFYNNTSGDLGNPPAGIVVGPTCITGQDPLFTDPANGDFSYDPNSPLVGAGSQGGNIGPSQLALPTPEEVAAAIWTRTGRTLTV